LHPTPALVRACLSVGRPHEPITQTQLLLIWWLALPKKIKIPIIGKSSFEASGSPTALAAVQKEWRNLPKQFYKRPKTSKAGRVRPVAPSGCGTARKPSLYPQNLPANAL